MATRTPASVTITIRADDGVDLIETDGSPSSAAGTFKNFVKCGSIGFFDEQLQEVFLEGLMCGSRSLPEHRMGAFGHTLDLDARHGASGASGAIMQAADQRGRPAKSCRAMTIRWIWLVPS